VCEVKSIEKMVKNDKKIKIKNKNKKIQWSVAKINGL
jgi:hypothetical protein